MMLLMISDDGDGDDGDGVSSANLAYARLSGAFSLDICRRMDTLYGFCLQLF